MKRLFILLFSMLLIFTVGAYAQTLVPDPVAEYANVFTTFAALVAVIPVVVELVKKLVPAITYRSIVTQIVSWIVGIAVRVSITNLTVKHHRKACKHFFKPSMFIVDFVVLKI